MTIHDLSLTFSLNDCMLSYYVLAWRDLSSLSTSFASPCRVRVMSIPDKGIACVRVCVIKSPFLDSSSSFASSHCEEGMMLADIILWCLDHECTALDFIICGAAA